jgi:hypothetical protein
MIRDIDDDGGEEISKTIGSGGEWQARQIRSLAVMRYDNDSVTGAS